MVINGVMLHNEGFVLLISFIISGIWIYSSRRNVNIMSVKVADILNTKFYMSTEDLINPQYFGYDEKGRELRDKVIDYLFENGIPRSFLYNGLISKHVDEWKRLGYLK